MSISSVQRSKRSTEERSIDAIAKCLTIFIIALVVKLSYNYGVAGWLHIQRMSYWHAFAICILVSNLGWLFLCEAGIRTKEKYG